jgi:hypothetical protein
MATRIKTRASNPYQEDLYAWSKTQADLLRAGRFAELDLEHVIDEIESGALRRSVRNRIRSVMEHLLKLEHSPAKEPRAGWRAMIRTQRVRLRDGLTPLLHRRSRTSCPNSTGMRAPWPKARFATTASTPPPLRYRRTAPTALTRSPPTGCRTDRLPAGREGNRCIKLSQARALPQILTLSGWP